MRIKIKEIHFKSIKTKIALIYFTIITSLIAIISATIYSSFQNNMLSRVAEDQKAISARSVANLNLLLSNLNYSFTYLSADHYMTEILNKRKLDIVSSFYYGNELWDQFDNIMCLPGTDIYSNSKYYLFLNDQLPLSNWLSDAQTEKTEIGSSSGAYTSKNIANDDWYRQAVKSNGKLCFCIKKDKNGVKQIYITKVIINNNLTLSQWVGVALIVLPSSAFSEQISNSDYGKDTYTFLVDDNKREFFSSGQLENGKISDAQLLDIVHKNGLEDDTIVTSIAGKRYVVGSYQTQWGWNLITAEPCPNFLMSETSLKMFALIVSIIMLGGLLTVIAAGSISRPIIDLAKKMKTIDIERPENFIEAKRSNDEIGILYDNFFRLMKKLCRLIEDIKLSYNKQLDAEFEALQAQINPHFLYNALNTINWTIMMRHQDDIAQSISELSDILKYNIGKTDSCVVLKDEIEHIKKYINIIKLRYGDSVKVCFDIGEGTLNCMMPKFVLQPLIENAFSHGIACKEQKSGQITVSSIINDNILKIMIEDDGVGADAAQINRRLEEKEVVAKHGHGLGVANVHNRIKMFAGNDYGLCFTTNKKGGITVTVTIPVIRDEKITPNT